MVEKKKARPAGTRFLIMRKQTRKREKNKKPRSAVNVFDVSIKPCQSVADARHEPKMKKMENRCGCGILWLGKGGGKKEKWSRTPQWRAESSKL